MQKGRGRTGVLLLEAKQLDRKSRCAHPQGQAALTSCKTLISCETPLPTRLPATGTQAALQAPQAPLSVWGSFYKLGQETLSLSIFPFEKTSLKSERMELPHHLPQPSLWKLKIITLLTQLTHLGRGASPRIPKGGALRRSTAGSQHQAGPVFPTG